MHINTHGLFNIKSILMKKNNNVTIKLIFGGGDEEGHTILFVQK